MKQIYNFSAGPACLPKAAIKGAKEAIKNFQDNGISLLEMSHRSAPVVSLFEEATNNLRDILEIPDNYGDQLADDAVRNVDWFIFDRTEIPVTWTGVDILDFQSDLRVSKRFVRVFNESGIEAYATPNAVQLAGLEPID